MKVILCGKNDAAVECLQFLVELGARVWAIGTEADDGKDGWQRSLKKAASRLGVPFDQPADINQPGVVQRLTNFESSVLVSLQYDQILRESLEIGCPCLNIHFSLLPRHRGVAPIAWAVFSGDSQAGATIHHMTRDIDAGEVIAQHRIPIALDDTARDVYDNVSAGAVKLFKRCHPFSLAQLAAGLLQDPSLASYHKQQEFDFSSTRINWRRPVLELQRWIRAMIFPPFQHPEFTCNGRTFRVTRIGPTILTASSSRPGDIVDASPQGLDVAAAGGVVRITNMIDPAAPRTSFPELIRAVSAGNKLA